MRWFLLALLGIAIAAGVSVAASRLASQQIGLASQPISAGDALAPQRHEPAAHRRQGETPPAKHASNPPPQAEPPIETTPPETSPVAPVEPSHEGDGGGADD